MRLIHTADWHLGHALYGIGREYEHGRFLQWLLCALEEEAADALIVAGDVFESANPPASAQAAWYHFLARLRRRLPDLDVVVIGGNHDSAARLDAPADLLRSLRIRIVGGLPRRGDGSIDVDSLLVPLGDRRGAVAAWMAAVPFLRPADLPRPCAAQTESGAIAGGGEPRPDPLVEAVRRIYAEVIDAARARRQPGQALLATGHCYLVGTELSSLSERRILGGNQHALPASLFPRDLAYVALGHLHKAQKVAGRAGLRYSGSPIPLATNEMDYRHQVCVVDLDGEELVQVRSRPVPRAVDFARIPRRGAAPLDQLLAAIDTLPGADRFAGAEGETRPYLEICACLPRPEPTLRARIEAALADKWARLVKLTVEYRGDGAALAEATPGVELREMSPEEVFLRRYRRDHEGEPGPELMAAYRDLLAELAAAAPTAQPPAGAR